MPVGRQQTSANELEHRALSDRVSLPPVYELWLVSWETALAAVAAASQSGAIAATDATTYRGVIAAERKIVSKHLELLSTTVRGASSRGFLLE